MLACMFAKACCLSNCALLGAEFDPLSMLFDEPIVACLPADELQTRN